MFSVLSSMQQDTAGPTPALSGLTENLLSQIERARVKKVRRAGIMRPSEARG